MESLPYWCPGSPCPALLACLPAVRLAQLRSGSYSLSVRKPALDHLSANRIEQSNELKQIEFGMRATELFFQPARSNLTVFQLDQLGKIFETGRPRRSKMMQCNVM
ncbi:hypothetical protein VTL71DRAFT_9218 [Oculimacula yallundae]|uniref:Uncharacterized protein n=1 Tax=Oculimacula yallundae TaxID=86028 RepID=A0ABR4BSE0_9HELO